MEKISIKEKFFCEARKKLIVNRKKISGAV